MTREPTEMEIRAAKAGYEAMRNCGLQNLSARAESPSVFLDASNPLHAFENQSRILQMDWVMAARAMIQALRNPPQELLTTYRRGTDASDPFGPEREIETRLPVEAWNGHIDRMSPPEGK